jgi:hypothetical protein
MKTAGDHMHIHDEGRGSRKDMLSLCKESRAGL